MGRTDCLTRIKVGIAIYINRKLFSRTNDVHHVHVCHLQLWQEQEEEPTMGYIFKLVGII